MNQNSRRYRPMSDGVIGFVFAGERSVPIIRAQGETRAVDFAAACAHVQLHVGHIAVPVAERQRRLGNCTLRAAREFRDGQGNCVDGSRAIRGAHAEQRNMSASRNA